MSVLQAPNILVVQLKVSLVFLFTKVLSVVLIINIYQMSVFVNLFDQRFEGIFGGKIDKAITFSEILVLSSFMSKASKVTLF